MPHPRRRPILIILAALIAMLAYEIGIGVLVHFNLLSSPTQSELSFILEDKVGFAAFLPLLLWATGTARDCGFAGRFKLRHLALLWPLWIVAGISAAQGAANHTPLILGGWLLASCAVALGEETIFRGIIIAAIGLHRPRSAVVISALLFGLMHLLGLASGLPTGIVLAQATIAGAFGLILGSTRIIANSIWPGLICHSLLDFFGLIISNSFSNAMQATEGEYIYLLSGSAVSVAWGLFLWSRLPKTLPVMTLA